MVPSQILEVLQFMQAVTDQWLAVQVTALRHELPIDEAADAISMSREELRLYVSRGELPFRSTEYVDLVMLAGC